MFLTMKYHYKPSKEEYKFLEFLCKISKNIYNCALYELRQAYIKQKIKLTLTQILAKISSNINYKILDSKQAYSIALAAYTNMAKYIKYHNDDGTMKKEYEYLGTDFAKFPKYRKKNSTLPLITNNVYKSVYQEHECIRLQLSYLTKSSRVFNQTFEDELVDKFIKEYGLKKSFDIYFRIPKPIKDYKIHQLRVVPKNKEFYIEFTYEKEDVKMKTQIKKSMAIDLGLSNLACAVTTDNEAFIIDGKKLKSINQFYNKQRAYFQSKLPPNIKYSKRLRKLDIKRNDRVEDYLNKAAAILLKKAEELQVDEIIIGWNKGIKEGGIKNEKLIGQKEKQVNQNFVEIPISRFKNKIVNKCNQKGIKTVVIDESYTSKASFYDKDPMYKTTFSGERFIRGLYRRKNGQLVNADVNAALNIYRKYIYKSNSKNNRIHYLMSRGKSYPYRVLVTL